MKVLFILDSSLSNPILQSQGIPQILSNSTKGVKYYIVSLENPNELLISSKNNERYTRTLALFGDSVKHIPVLVPFYKNHVIQNNSYLRAIRFFLLICKTFFVVYLTVKKENIKIVHCRSHFPTLIGVFIKLILRISIIYDNRGLYSEEMRTKKFSFFYFMNLFLEKNFIKLSDKTVVVSEAFEKHLENKYSLNKPFEVITNGFSINRINFSVKKREEMRNQFGFDDKIVMVYSGSISKWQKFDSTLKAFSILKTIVHNSILLILTPDEEETRQFIENSEDNIKDFYLFNVVGDDLGDYMMMGDFAVLFRDNNLINRVAAPIKFSEYLGAGLPVLISKDIGDYSEFVVHHKVGSVIHDDLDTKSIKEILNLCQQPDIHIKCKNTADKYLSIKTTTQKYLDLYILLETKYGKN